MGLDLAEVGVDNDQLRVLGKGDTQRAAHLPAGGRAVPVVVWGAIRCLS